MKLKKIFIFPIISLLTIGQAHAQPNAGKLELGRVIPPAPEMASLGSFGQIPVSLCTGNINVQVPFFTDRKSTRLNSSH